MLILIKGAGDLASGVALRLHRCHFSIIMTDLPQPTAIRRRVAFSTAIAEGSACVEGIVARRAENSTEALAITAAGEIAVLVDPAAACCQSLQPLVLIDAILAKKNLGTAITDAPLVIALGPGFAAGADCHCVIETQRGHTLGRPLYQGSALPNTGCPGSIGGYTTQRILRSPCSGTFFPLAAIGDTIAAGQRVAWVEDPQGLLHPISADIDGILRGVLLPKTSVCAGMKSGDIDPRCLPDACFTVSDKALAIGGGVLEAILHHLPPLYSEHPVRENEGGQPWKHPSN